MKNPVVVMKVTIMAAALAGAIATGMAQEDPGGGGGGGGGGGCLSGCHMVVLQYLSYDGSVTEYSPYHAHNPFLTPMPDGGARVQTQLAYQWRSYPFGSPACSPCPGGCLGNASIQFPPSQWFQANRAYCTGGPGGP